MKVEDKKDMTYLDMLLTDETSEKDEKVYQSELARNSADAELVELRRSITIKTKAIKDLYKTKPFSLVKIVNDEAILKSLSEKLEIMEAKFAVLFPKTK